MKTESNRKIESFHDHLDRCRRCRDNPFDLCKAGDKLLKGVVAKEEKAKGQRTNPV